MRSNKLNGAGRSSNPENKGVLMRRNLKSKDQKGTTLPLRIDQLTEKSEAIATRIKREAKAPFYLLRLNEQVLRFLLMRWLES